ncbi:hypothetical protein OG738_26500 [Amycolatopsis sp. NBC_01488]|uniref:hypothetical protein n=1 Tax=Amycolatopsis sp. NBC_01488 TaxID=2903563 RepID=UPI002E2E6DF5|nr:hypothetical protein [Amycolatopsis sp. NBC_01488]
MPAVGSVAWLDGVRRRCETEVSTLVSERVREHFTGHAADTPAAAALPDFVTGGKFLRPLFAYAGWRCGGPESAASSVVVLTAELADRRQRAELTALLALDVVDDGAVGRWRSVITATGARDQLEKFIDERVHRALEVLDLTSLPVQASGALGVLAGRCTERVR